MTAIVAAEQARDIAQERWRTVFESAAVGAELADLIPRPVTTSIGVATTENPATAPEDLVRAADKAMYRGETRTGTGVSVPRLSKG